MRANLIVNRRARRLVPATSRLLDELRRARAAVQLFETSSTEELDRAASSIARDERSAGATVILAGGDGSYMAGVSSLSRAFGDRPLPPIALAPGGTVGTIARNFGVRRGEPAEVAREIVEAVLAGMVRTRRTPTLRIVEGEAEDEEGENTQPAMRDDSRVGFIFGAGLVSRFFEVYDETPGGNAAAARIVARIFGGSFVGAAFARRVLDPARCTIAIDGKPAPFDRVSLLCASVVRNLGLGMKLLYRAGERIDRFHVVATPLPARLLGPQMPLVLAGRPLRGPRVDKLVRELTLRFPTGTGAYVLDGDLCRADTITVRRGPALSVVSPL